MQKIITISMLTAILSLPAFAQIANNATCNNTNLGQSDNNSTANVEANWNANTININWYNGDTKITSNTCTYDGTITLPAQPSKPGYTFAGWRLKSAAAAYVKCSLRTNQTDCLSDGYCSWGNNACWLITCHSLTDENSCGSETDDCSWIEYEGICIGIGEPEPHESDDLIPE